MDRRQALSDGLRLTMLLRAVRQHQWARMEFLRAASGLRAVEFEAALRLALAHRLVEQGEIRVPRRSPRRLGLTAAGATELGLNWSLPTIAGSWLCALKLDPARRLLQRWIGAQNLVWALSPFTLPARALRPVEQAGWKTDRPEWRELAFRSLRLDGLACVKVDVGQYLNVALVVDPGGIALDWFVAQFRSAYAWARRTEFRGREYAYPVFVLVACDSARLPALVRLWHECARAGQAPCLIRATTLAEVDQLVWRNERGGPSSLWGCTTPFGCPSQQPHSKCEPWWGELARDELQANRSPDGQRITSWRKGLLRWAEHSHTCLARLVTVHGRVGLQARELLDRVGQYPLLGAAEMAAVLGCTARNVRNGLAELRRLGLIEQAEDDQGYLLTGQGLSLLAAQAGLAPAEYARLRHWPLQRDGERLTYSANALRAAREHTRLVLSFLIGLRRHGPAVGLRLHHWEHVLCQEAFPAQSEASVSSASPMAANLVLPDAVGTVRRVGKQGQVEAEMDFWLEVDRGTVQGSALTVKLQRYFEAMANWAGQGRRRPRLLVLVERNDEGRLELWRRRLAGLQSRFRAALDVHLTRVDLLGAGPNDLDPTRPAWRALESNTFVSSFDL